MPNRNLPRSGAKKKPVARKASKPTAKRAKSALKSAKSTRASLKSTPAKGKWVYSFGDGRAEMANLALPVPPGFTITTDVCTYYYAHDKQYPKDLERQVDDALARVGKITGKGFGDKSNPP